ncbi:glycosyltransferase [Tsukamurella paurometabola]|uniref:GDP-mannose-dependent alpha-(1-6)-phosphatidylinositol monomannoside mannosyltransferase n=1 Tax=Tsukamurella paurometabola TaxID=2061 RepID=A0A3P8KER2_TSUPA|nr:glycosyltransferase [Tsukamurella paurometabola]UEA81356.1 glycosyltransferase [Tsukamurella paurometabola]VDR38338.1 GDP-mannose-dependent alpha-(1-6)-phosphatidylinositol monomannoside mannosyltransferase [Tsukamurella paurometabola]
MAKLTTPMTREETFVSSELDRAYLRGGVASEPPPAEPGEHPLVVLVVAYRNPGDLRACLDSVAVHLPGIRTLIWDNSGHEWPGMAALRDEFSGVEWHTDGTNRGFAAGVNRLAALAPEADLLLLNPDAVLLGDLAATREALRSPGVAAAAPRIQDSALSALGGRDWDVAHRRRGLVRALVSYAGYAPRLRGTPLSDLYADAPADVEGYLTGACLAIQRDAWDALGPFDEEFFLYGEESDWQWRARRAGWRLVLTDDAGVEHAGHGTVVDDVKAGRRSTDLLRANIALNLEHARGVRAADTYLAGTALLDRVQRSTRRARAAAQRRTAKPSVVITTNRLVYGGAERQHALLAAELDRRGYPVTIACMQRFGPIVAEIPHSVRVVRQPWWAPALDPAPGPQILISATTNTETGFASLWRAGSKDRRWLVAAHSWFGANGTTFSAPLARAMRRADGFVGLAPGHWDVGPQFQNLRKPVFTAPNGIVSAAELGTAPPVRPARVAGRPPHLVMLSRIVEWKNPHLLVEALAGIDAPWELSIYGDGPDRERLERLTPQAVRDRVHWRGWTSGPDAGLADADLLCVPSRDEAFPMVILEAMARGIPVAASAVGAIPAMLNDGAAGRLVWDITVDGWRAELIDLLAHPEAWPESGDRGFQWMRANYSIEAMADGYETAFAGVLE